MLNFGMAQTAFFPYFLHPWINDSTLVAVPGLQDSFESPASSTVSNNSVGWRHWSERDISGWLKTGNQKEE